MSNEELQKKIDEYCVSQENCKECIFNDAVNRECLADNREWIAYSSEADILKRSKALERFKKEVLGEEISDQVKQKDALDKAIEKYGEWQLVKASQDCRELAHALNKYYCMKQTDDTCDFNKLEANIVEEIADVEIMIEQVKRLLSINNRDIELIKENKIERLEHVFVHRKGENIK